MLISRGSQLNTRTQKAKLRTGPTSGPRQCRGADGRARERLDVRNRKGRWDGLTGGRKWPGQKGCERACRQVEMDCGPQSAKCSRDFHCDWRLEAPRRKPAGTCRRIGLPDDVRWMRCSSGASGSRLAKVGYPSGRETEMRSPSRVVLSRKC
ncbi:hypothetical protein BGZ63DRAFT_121335 [Mariannaea sp. PMI_226]|nr:hypothetical protein BGZ63DRAFT_121335 [Mariannaea sp. PMI_226]